MVSIARAGSITYNITKDRNANTCYEKVEETTFEGGFNIICKGDGDKDCKFRDGTVPPMVRPVFDHVESMINQQVNNGVSSGSGEMEGIIYNWTGNEATGYSYTLSVVE